MKVLLINPPRENEIFSNNPRIIEEERGYNPPLGLLYVAAYLTENSDYDVTVIDSQVEELTYEALKGRIKMLKPDVVGMTAMTMTLLDVIKTVDVVKEVDGGITVVLGGPHVNLFPEETISLVGVDYLVLGEGEIAFKELLDNMESEKRLKKVPGLVFKADNNDVVNTGPHRIIEDLDAIPFPARNLVPYRKYSSLLTRGKTATTMITSRGCPFRCTFCDRPHLGKRFRARSYKNVVDELEECVNMGISEFLIYDDTFTVDKKRVISICEEIVRRRLDIGFDIRARVDTVNAEMLRALKKAGCRGIHYGVESATDKILKVLNKGITIGQVREVFELTKRHKIPILAYFMIGNPKETKVDIETTFRIMKQLRPDYVHVTIFTPFPGTKIYLDGLESGFIRSDFWREFAKNPVSGFEIPVWEEHFTREELFEMIVRVYKDFYLRPSYVLSRLVKVKSMHELTKKMKAGLSVLFMKKDDGEGDG